MGIVKNKTLSALNYILSVIFICSFAALAGAHDIDYGEPARQCQRWFDERPFLNSSSGIDVKIITSDLLCLDGYLDADVATDILSWADQDSSDQKSLVVRSGGGEAQAGLEIAEKLQSNNIHVYIYDICASSCANYLFAMARHRHILDEAIVLFHGGYSDRSKDNALILFDKMIMNDLGIIEDVALARESIVEDFNSKISLQNKLYDNVAVSRNIIYGVDNINLIIEESDSKYIEETNSCDFLTLSKSQLEMLGVSWSGGNLISDEISINKIIEDIGMSYHICDVDDSFFNSAFMEKKNE